MSEVTNEVMENETMEIEGPMETEVTDYTEDSNGESGKSLATILAVGAGVAAAGAVVYKKLKAKRADKTKKKTRKRLMLVDVPIDDGVIEEVDEVDDIAETESKPEQK